MRMSCAGPHGVRMLFGKPRTDSLVRADVIDRLDTARACARGRWIEVDGHLVIRQLKGFAHARPDFEGVQRCGDAVASVAYLGIYAVVNVRLAVAEDDEAAAPDTIPPDGVDRAVDDIGLRFSRKSRQPQQEAGG